MSDCSLLTHLSCHGDDSPLEERKADPSSDARNATISPHHPVAHGEAAHGTVCQGGGRAVQQKEEEEEEEEEEV